MRQEGQAPDSQGAPCRTTVAMRRSPRATVAVGPRLSVHAALTTSPEAAYP
jgi:hypothetical protein